MGTGINTIAAQEIKRRGVIALEEGLRRGPIHILKRNRAVCVVLSETEFQELLDQAATARLADSLADLQDGRVAFSSSREILDEIS